MTYIQLINTVLRRLRENEVTTPNETDYSQLVGDFVNEAKREVEDAWNWNVLRSTIIITTTADTARYELTDSGDRYRTLEVYNDTQNMFMHRQHHSWMTKNLIEAATTGSPLYYDYNDKTSNEDTYVDVFPIPDAAYDLNFNLVLPQDDFSLGTEVLEVPHWPVVLGAYAKAIAERGEDQGNTHGEALRNYNQALGDAIAIDMSNTTGEDTWYYA